ncbi:hypothetical protein C8J56DRAFT_1118725 [Mycena floridula]|nr:hypothetical protein C8J56DRAFT_1118725 [Mycena floridula]
MEGLSWSCPSQDFAYSLGDPKGGSSNVKVYPLTDNKGEQAKVLIKAWVWDYTFNKLHAQRPLETWIPMSMSIGSFRCALLIFFGNIYKLKASETAKVRTESKVTSDWIENKIQSKFTIQSLCHQESFILLDIWKAGNTTTNIIESSNRDVNQEGIACSLVGGTISGKSYDLATLKVQENHTATGISSSYRPGHIQQSVNRTVHQKVKGQCKSLEHEDNAIIKHNNVHQIQAYQDAVSDLEASLRRNLAPSTLKSKVNRWNKALQSLQTARDGSLVLWKAKKVSGDINVVLE